MATTEETIQAPVDHSTPKQASKTIGRELEDGVLALCDPFALHLINWALHMRMIPRSMPESPRMIPMCWRGREDCHERKSLQTLQQSAVDDTAFVGAGVIHVKSKTQNSKCSEKMRFKPIHGPVKVFRDSDDTQENCRDRHRAVEMDSKATQTDDSLLEDLIQQRLREVCKRDHSSLDEEDSEAYELMVKEPVPESYWKEVAEQRRLALSDTLEENKSLHQSLDSLKEENEKLLELASQAEELSSLLQSVVSDGEEGQEEADNGSPETQDTGDSIPAGESDDPVISTQHQSQDTDGSRDTQTETSVSAHEETGISSCGDQTGEVQLKE